MAVLAAGRADSNQPARACQRPESSSQCCVQCRAFAAAASGQLAQALAELRALPRDVGVGLRERARPP